ncbi:MAG: hypothetical protein M1825_006442 [Sarcosagium campestre]|nr:MAG: hypothetical protein M1825_006442 [Sarcosagium campestre]
MAAVSAPHAANSQASQRTWNPSPGEDQLTGNSSDSLNIHNDLHEKDTNFGQGSTRLKGSGLSSYPSQTFSKTPASTDQYSSTKPSYNPKQDLAPPTRLKFIGRKVSEGSEADSLLDLYGRDSTERSRKNSMDQGVRKAVNGASVPKDEDGDTSRWIHRDKLARIENEELQRAGIVVPREISHPPKRRNRREPSRDKLSDDFTAEAAWEEEKARQRQAPPSQVEVEEYEAEPITFDLRLPDEAAEDPYEERHERALYTPLRPASQKGSLSRIPLPTSSPLPIRQDFIDMDTPTQRNGGGTWNGIEEGSIAYKKTRNRSQSAGSRGLLSDGEDQLQYSPTKTPKATPPGSPKTRMPKPPGSSHGRRPSATREFSGQSRVTPRSRDPTGPRPTTRSGDNTPAKRPEGDPPWITNAYKPDPRLPPDQQLLPTVAKRLQQEQWEREGKPGSVYDRDFNPLDINDVPPPDLPPVPPEAEKRATPVNEWPLSPQQIPSPDDAAGVNGNDHGGYKTTPIASPNQGRHSMTQPPIRLPDAPEENEKKKGGCSCCVIM